MNKPYIYSDLNTYTPTSNPLLYDIASLYQAIDNLLNTKRGERLFRPEYGLDLEDELFELTDKYTDDLILKEIIDSINLNEPRITVDSKNCELVRYPDDNMYKIYITFSLKGLKGQSFKFETALKK